ncbi:MAG TPA: hypothetical protein VF587_13700, partial [Solirubrobacteraceae bacterium]
TAIYIVAVGPDQVGEQMGKSCRRSQNGQDVWCNWRDALSIMQAFPWVTLVGAVFLAITQPERPASDGTSARSRFGGLRAAGAAAVVIITVVNLAGTFVYRHTYSISETVERVQEYQREAKKADFSQTSAPAEPAAASAPRGLARGSLLRAGAFRSALAEIRRAAPAGARITGLRVAADRIDVSVLAGGKVVKLARTWNTKAKVESSVAATDGDDVLITFDRVDTAAPQRIARAAGGMGRIDYLVLQDIVGLRWNAFLADGKGSVAATPDGRTVQ